MTVKQYSIRLILCAFCCALLPPAPTWAQDQEEEIKAASKRLSSDAMYYDALRSKFLGDAKQEELLLKKFIKERPEIAAAYYELAGLLLAKNNTDDAEEYIRKAVQLDNTNIWYKLTFADALKRRKKFDEAAKVYLDIAATGNSNKGLYFDAAYSFQRADKNKEAIAALEELIKKSPTDEENALIAQQEIYMKMEDAKSAIAIAEILIKKYPKEGKYYSNLASIYSDNNQPEEAYKVYQEGIAKFPNEPTLQYGMALYHLKKKELALYDEYITRAILNPDVDERIQAETLRRYLADVDDDSLRKANALITAKKLLEQQPESELMQSIYGQILVRNNQPEEAARYFKMALATNPSQFEIWQELLLANITANNTDSLLVNAKKALRYFPNSAIIYYFTGIGYLGQKEYTQSIKNFNRAIELQPEDNALLLADMYSSLAEAYNNIKEYPRSDSAFEKSLRLNHDNASVLNNYSYYLSERGLRLEAAERMSKRSLELRPGEATFLDTYGWILYKQGKYSEAKKYIEEAILKSQNADGTLWDHLGDINYKLNNVAEAVQNWLKAKEKGTENILIDKKIKDQKLYE